MNERPAAEGLLVVDKPAGWTSHDVVAKLRGMLRERRVGHAGTLDPDATGVLLVGVGRVTRLLRFLSELDKHYRAEVVFGVETSTLDASGEVTARHEMTELTLDRVKAAAATLTGTIQQVPPMVSAIHHEGRRLHELAREGIEVERAPRTVTVKRFGIEPTADPHIVRIDVVCSSGTYVRSLGADLGTRLGGGAHIRNLRRYAIGPFTEADAVVLEAVTSAHLRPAVEAVPGAVRVVADGEIAAAVAHGKVLARDTLARSQEALYPKGSGEGPWAIVDGEGNLVAVYEPYRDSLVKPAVVLAAGTGR